MKVDSDFPHTDVYSCAVPFIGYFPLLVFAHPLLATTLQGNLQVSSVVFVFTRVVGCSFVLATAVLCSPDTAAFSSRISAVMCVHTSLQFFNSFLLLLAGASRAQKMAQVTQTKAGTMLGLLQHTSGDTSTDKHPHKTAPLALRIYLLHLHYSSNR